MQMNAVELITYVKEGCNKKKNITSIQTPSKSLSYFILHIIRL